MQKCLPVLLPNSSHAAGPHVSGRFPHATAGICSARPPLVCRPNGPHFVAISNAPGPGPGPGPATRPVGVRFPGLSLSSGPKRRPTPASAAEPLQLEDLPAELQQCTSTTVKLHRLTDTAVPSRPPAARKIRRPRPIKKAPAPARASDSGPSTGNGMPFPAPGPALPPAPPALAASDSHSAPSPCSIAACPSPSLPPVNSPRLDAYLSGLIQKDRDNHELPYVSLVVDSPATPCNLRLAREKERFKAMRCVCVCVFLFRLPAEEDSNSGLQGGGRLHGRCTTLRKLGFPIHPSCFPCPECFPVCVWRGGGTQHTLNLGYGNGSARAPPRAVFMVCCAVQN